MMNNAVPRITPKFIQIYVRKPRPMLDLPPLTLIGSALGSTVGHVFCASVVVVCVTGSRGVVVGLVVVVITGGAVGRGGMVTVVAGGCIVVVVFVSAIIAAVTD